MLPNGVKIIILIFLFWNEVILLNDDFFILQKEVEKVNDVAVKIEEKTATVQVSA